MTSDFLPNRDADLVIWFNNFQTKLPSYATALGLVVADTTAVTNDYNMLAYIINLVEVFKQETKERVGYKDIFRDGPIGTPTPAAPVIPVIVPPATIPTPGIIPRLRLLVKRIKANPNYTQAMGQDLGVIAPAPPAAIPKPKGSANSISGSQVEIRFIKKGFVGVLLESRRNSEVIWTSLGIVIASPYLDNRPPLVASTPEIRYYRLRYVKGNTPVGDDSDILQITTTP